MGAHARIHRERERHPPHAEAWDRRFPRARPAITGRHRVVLERGGRGSRHRFHHPVRDGRSTTRTGPQWPQWFIGGGSTSTYNCVQRNAERRPMPRRSSGRAKTVRRARSPTRSSTEEVSRVADGLLELGHQVRGRGRRVHADGPRGDDRARTPSPGSERSTCRSSLASERRR